MKKIYKIAAFFLLLSSNVFAQYSIDWIRPADNFQKSGVMMARDNDDNAVVTGYLTSNNIYTSKYDKFGNFQWQKFSASGIPSNYERPYWINTDNNNNVFVVGCRYVGTSQQYPNALVVLKYSPGGALLWKDTIPMTIFVNNFIGFNMRSEVDANGNLYIGTVAVTPSGFTLVKVDPNGNILFTSSNNLNGVNQFRSMRLKGNKVVFCGSSGNLSAAPVVVWDTTGNLLWTGSFLGQSGNDVEIDDAGNTYLLTSYANQVTPSSGQDIMIYKLNAAGTQVWVKNYDFGGYDFPTRFTFVADKISVTGYGSISASYFDWITFQINTSGTLLWNTRYNGTTSNDEQPYAISAKANGEVFVSGKGGPTPDPTQLSGLRKVTLKYSNTGALAWLDTAMINNYNWGIASSLASDNSLYLVSQSGMTVVHILDHTGTGTCNIPAGLNVANIANTCATFSWTPVSGATLYHLRYKTTTSNTWTVVSFNLPSINIYNLYAGTSYNYAVEAVCSSGPSGFSAIQTFTTTGAGYCSSNGQSQVQEYLSLVWLQGIMLNSSGRDGYGDFTHLIAMLTQGQTVNGYLSGLVPYPEYENYGIWIDYNHDNDFDDPGEQVVTLNSNFTGYISFNFTVPVSAPLGSTRMRVVMNHDNTALPCGVYARGETEDYTVLINDNSTVPPPIPAGLYVSSITNTSATFSWTPDNTAVFYHLRYKKTTETNWTIASVNIPSINVNGLTANTFYHYACESVGSAGPSGYTATQTFVTGIPLSINGINIVAKRQGVNVLVNWSTLSEQNSAWFDVERSYLGIDFIRVGQVQAAGFSNTVRNYQFTDVNVAQSLIYYRLKMVDADAGYKLSPVRVVTKSDGNKQEFLLFPNPATTNINILLNEATTEDMQLQIFNQMGQMVRTTRITKGIQVINLDVSELPKGIYAITFTGSNAVGVNRLIIK